jgi:hypothetical protein
MQLSPSAMRIKLCPELAVFVDFQNKDTVVSVNQELTYWQKAATMFSRENDKLKAELQAAETLAATTSAVSVSLSSESDSSIQMSPPTREVLQYLPYNLA